MKLLVRFVVVTQSKKRTNRLGDEIDANTFKVAIEREQTKHLVKEKPHIVFRRNKKNGFSEDPSANLKPQSIKTANPNKIKLERRNY